MLRPGKRTLIATAVLAGIALIATLWVIFNREQHAATATDGRKVSIAKVTRGTIHSFTEGRLWVRLLKPLMGARWAARRGCYEVRFTNATPALMVWTHWDGMHETNPLPIEAAIGDAHGTETELVLSRWNGQAWWTRSDDPRKNQAYVAWLFKNFPRRSEMLHLHVYDRDERMSPTQAVSIAFSNPVRAKTPLERGRPLPLSVTNAGTVFTLNRLAETSNALWRFDFIVHTNGQPDPSWRIAELTASDPTGNVFGTRSNIAPGAAASLAFALPGALWPDEPVWHFAVEFCRAADFAPSELWHATAIPVPPKGTPFQLSTNLGLATSRFDFRLESVPLQVPYHLGGVRRNANIFLRLHSPVERLFLLKATDDQGREATIEPGHITPDGLRNFGLVTPREAKSLDFTFAVRKSTVIKFDVLSTSLMRQRGDP